MLNIEWKFEDNIKSIPESIDQRLIEIAFSNNINSIAMNIDGLKKILFLQEFINSGENFIERCVDKDGMKKFKKLLIKANPHIGDELL